MSVIKDNKNYGTKVKIVELEPNPFPEYLTVDYSVPDALAELKILNTTDNISGWRYKGETEWRTPVTTISTTTIGTITLEFNLTDNTQIARNQFTFCTNVSKIELPASVTSIGTQAFYNCRNLGEVPILQNLVYIGGDMFSSTPVRASKIVINDDIQRDWNSVPVCTEYAYVNGRLLSLMGGSVEDGFQQNNMDLDLSNGIDGLEIKELSTGIRHYKSIKDIKLPSSLQKFGWVFMNSTIENVYFYGTTPPQPFNGDCGFFVDCNITGNIYVPAESIDAYKSVNLLFRGNDFTDKIVAMPA